MDGPPPVRRERLWARRYWRTLLVVFVVLPALAGVATTGFEQAAPRDVPVAVAPATDSATTDELQAVDGVADGVGKPVRYDSVADARAALSRERVYGVIAVQHGLYDEDATVTLRLYVEGSVVPYEQPSRAVAAALGESDAGFPATVTGERVVVEPRRTLSEYLLATLPLLLLPVYALTYVPARAARNRGVVDRIRAESSLLAMVGAKLAAATVFAGVVVLSLAAVGVALGYDVALLAPGALAALALSFVALAATSIGITVVSSFSTTGRFANVVLLVGLVAFSNLFYPAGFFSAIRREIAAWMPLHHAAVVVHATALRGMPASAVADRLYAVLAAAAIALVWMIVAVLVYERRLQP